MAVLIPSCLEADFNAAMGECTVVTWIPQPSLLPELPVEDAQLIGAKIALLWAMAFAFRLIRKKLNQS